MKIEGVDLLLVPKLITGWTDFNRVFMKRSIQLTVNQQGSNQFYFGLTIKSTQNVIQIKVLDVKFVKH